MYWIFELCYSLFRISRVPVEAERLASIPFGVIVFLPLISLLVVFGINILPFESTTGNTFLLVAYLVLPMLSGHYIVVKPLGYGKRARARDAIVANYSWGRRILNFFLFFVLFWSFVWVPPILFLLLILLEPLLAAV